MCKNGRTIREYVKSLENDRVYVYFLTEFYVAGDYKNFRDYVKSLVTLIPYNIYTTRLSGIS